MDNLVSILIPTYNRAQYLRGAIESALAQTYVHLEVLVLDDCSPDNTPAVVAEYMGDPRVQYVRHEKNLGITGNWKFGIEKATGEYFCLLHDDDTLGPDCVSRLAEPLAEDDELILSFCGHWLMNAEGQRLAEETDKNDQHFKRDTLATGKLKNFAKTALLDLSIPVGSALFRRSKVTPEFITPEAKGAIDIWLLYQCVRTGYGAYYIPERLMNYRLHGAGMSHSMPQYMLEGHLFRHRSILADTKMTSLHATVKPQLTGTLTHLGVTLLRQGAQGEARQILKEALQQGATAKSLLGYCLSYGGSFGTRAANMLRKH